MTETDPHLTEQAKSAAKAAGADAVGVTTTEPFPEVGATIRRRVAEGANGPLRFTFDDPDTASDPRATFPWATHLVSVGRAYVPEAGRADPRGGRVARFATADHYAPLLEAADAAADRLREHGHRAEVIADDPRLVDRAVAVRSGIGWWGKNSMVLAPKVGPWMLLASIATDAPLAVDEPMRRDCGTCDACLPACPTGALVAPGVLDARLCLATWLQAPGDLPLELREAMGGRIYGCDDCVDACPPGSRLAAGPGRTSGSMDLLDLLELDDEGLLDRHAHWYVPRREGRYLRRNVVVALANTGGPEAWEPMVDLARHPSALIRRHAAWGVGRLGERLGRDDTAAVLSGLLDDEGVADVIAALETALENAS